MKKLELAALMVMESVSEPQKPKDLKVCRDMGLFYLQFRSILQDFGVRNRNRRTYDEDPMVQSLGMPHILELQSKKAWKGEFGHPLSDEPKRILTIEPKLTCHKINQLHFSKGMVSGDIETLDDGNYGTQFTKNILQGMEPAFSLRALAQVLKRPDGSSLVKSRSHVVTYDAVILPSHQKAYRDESVPIKRVIKSAMDDGNIVTESSRVVPILESQIADFIAMESTNVKLVSNVFEVACESMTFTKDLKFAILKEAVGGETTTFYVPIEERAKHDVRSFLSKL